MFVRGVDINGFPEKQLLNSQKSALNAKVLIEIRHEKVK